MSRFVMDTDIPGMITVNFKDQEVAVQLYRYCASNDRNNKDTVELAVREFLRKRGYI